MARSVKRVSLPSSASLFSRAWGNFSTFPLPIFGGRFPFRPDAFSSRFFSGSSRSRAYGELQPFSGSDLRQLVYWLSLDIFRGNFYPHFPVRAISRRHVPFTRDARGRMDRGDTGTDAGPADRTTRSTSPADRMNGSTLATCTEGTADRRQRAPHRENVTRSRSRRRTTTSTRRGIDPWQVYPGSNEGPEKARNAPMKPAFIVSPSHVPPAANAGEGHTRGRLTSGTSPGSPAGNANWCNWRQLRRSHAADTDRSTPGTAEGPQKARSRFYIVCMVTNTTALYKRPKSHLRGRSSF